MDRREHTRVALDIPFFTVIHIEGIATTFQAIVADISSGGLQLSFPPDTENIDVYLGKKVSIDALPGFEGTGIEGILVWVSKTRCGVRLTEELHFDDNELKEIARSL